MADKFDVREAALDVLLDMEKNDRPSHIAMEEARMRLTFAPKRDRAFFTRLCEGTTERRLYLDYVLDSFSGTKMNRCKPLIRNLLRMSAYQILFLKVRDGAAVSEAVRLAKKRGFTGLSGFVNGVLRTLIRKKDALPMPDPAADPLFYLSVVYSMPLWLVKLLREQYGPERTQTMLAAFLKERPLTARTCFSKISPEELKKRLLADGVCVKQGRYFPYAFSLSGYSHLEKLSAYKDGLFLIQDESSMLPAAAAQIREGDRVLDVCAAPGGKTFHAADLTGEKGLVIARDLTEYKTDRIRENNDRMNYKQVLIQTFDAAVYDPSLAGTMDVVLADLPCSGLGVMGRKNDIKYRLTKEQLEELIVLQRRILSTVWQYLKPGGRLIYSTCTLNRGENQENLSWLTKKAPLRTVSMEEQLPEALRGRTGKEGWLQLVPGEDACDGFFVAKLMREG